MQEMIRMVVVLTILSSVSGGLLASIRNGTLEQKELQQYIFDKAPAINQVLEGKTNDPGKDNFKLTHEDTDFVFYIGKFEDGSKTVVFESKGAGFSGDVGLMVGVDIETDKIKGIGVTTHSETPGIGSKAKTDPAFRNQFIDMDLSDEIKVKDDGGNIDALSGATITSKAVCSATSKAGALYQKLKPQILENMKSE